MNNQMDIITALANGTVPLSILRLAAQAVLSSGGTAPMPPPVVKLEAEPGSAAKRGRPGRRIGSTASNSEACWKHMGGEAHMYTMTQLRILFGVSPAVIGEQRRVIYFLRTHRVDFSGMTWGHALNTAKSMGFLAK